MDDEYMLPDVPAQPRAMRQGEKAPPWMRSLFAAVLRVSIDAAATGPTDSERQKVERWISNQDGSFGAFCEVLDLGDPKRVEEKMRRAIDAKIKRRGIEPWRIRT